MAYDLEPLPRTETPSDYTRFKFDPSNVGDKRIVGLLACQRDPLLRSLETKIHSIREANVKTAPPPKGKGNKKKGSASASTSNGDSAVLGEGDKGKLYEIELLDTVIFPEGGGQPSDTGHISLLESDGYSDQSFVIESCLRKNLDSVHLVRVPAGQEIDWKEGDTVRVDVDWDRRVDHMTIHTSQHLLSAILDQMELFTLSWSMHPYPSLEAPYIELPRSLTQSEAEQVERRCNELISEGRKVWVDISIQGGNNDDKDKAGQEVQQDDVDETISAYERLKIGKGIPVDYDGGVIRHINIDQTDRNACCGTQVPTLSLISLMHIIPPTTTSNSPTKLYFVAGPRAVRYLQHSSRQLSNVAKIIGSGRTEVVDRLEILEKNRKESFESVKSLRNELSKSIIDKLLHHGRRHGRGIAWLHRENIISTHDFEFLSNVSINYITNYPNPNSDPHKNPLVILTSTIQGNKDVSQNQTLLVAHSNDHELAKEVNESIKKALEGRLKGGGARGKYMSKIEGVWGKGEINLLNGIVDDLRESRIRNQVGAGGEDLEGILM